MPTQDLFDTPFDAATIAKLEIFEDYAKAWIPSFVMQNRPRICIFDFFAGAGYDKRRVAGSPIRILEKIKPHLPAISQRGVEICVYLNEFEPGKKQQNKFEMLKSACTKYLENNKDLAREIKIKYFNEDCEKLFHKLYPIIQEFPSLVYLDQNGIKFLSDKYLLALEKTRETDFLYFLSSSYIWQLGDTSEFSMHVNFDMSELKQNPYLFINRGIIEQLRQRLPKNTLLKLYPFSLRKRSNIYGIIFGASHPRAVDKFLNIAWGRSPINGDANFDIDDDCKKGQLNIFENKKLTKIDAFKRNLWEKVMAKEISNNFEALNFVHNEGHIGKHASECLKEMKRNGEIDYDGLSPLVTYENVYKNKRKLEYKIKYNGTLLY